MTGNADDQPPANSDEKTIFVPPGKAAAPPDDVGRAIDGPQQREPGSRVAPIPPPLAPPPEPVADAPSPAGGAALTSLDASTTSFAPRTDGKSIQVGDILNHIFEVKRFIARGGMGEVFEGINVTSDERVAIKVMLPALAADASVISMFRKEARTLTKLQHEALVQYRVLAQEPQLGVLYIVTEYIDGTNLSDVLKDIKASPAELLGLLRRLAEGLRAAHALGAIHRDISPDNVLLEDGKLDRAKVIDFGIAKDLDPGSATIVGDGFAGKLNYVAPEQLGDFGRTIGAWTDVYSLALVIMAVALGRNVQMGGSLVDAVDKRRAGPDLSELPEPLRPILAMMLKPNPTDRLASMGAVIAELDRINAPPLPPSAKSAGKPANRTLMIAGGAALLVLVALVGWLSFSRHATTPQNGGTSAAVVNRDPVAMARSVVDAALPSVSCTWLQIVDVTRASHGPLIKLTGVAGNPSAAQSEISQALAQQKIGGADLDFENVSPITQSGCAALDGYRQIRAAASNRLTVPQHKFEMRMQPKDPALSGYPGEIAANVVLQINLGDPKLDFALVGIAPSGVIDYELIPGLGAFNRAQLTDQLRQKSRTLSDVGGDKYKMQLELNHPGWSGMLLITGKPPFPKELIAPPIGARGPNWTQSFVSTAAERGWQADMVWFKTVDEVKE